ALLEQELPEFLDRLRHRRLLLLRSRVLKRLDALAEEEDREAGIPDRGADISLAADLAAADPSDVRSAVPAAVRLLFRKEQFRAFAVPVPAPAALLAEEELGDLHRVEAVAAEEPRLGPAGHRRELTAAPGLRKSRGAAGHQGILPQVR